MEFADILIFCLIIAAISAVLSCEPLKSWSVSAKLLVIAAILWLLPILIAGRDYEELLQKPSILLHVYRDFLPTTLGIVLCIITVVGLCLLVFSRPKSTMEDIDDEAAAIQQHINEEAERQVQRIKFRDKL